MSKSKVSDSEWKKKLSPEQFNVLRKKGTEAPFSGKLIENKKEGIYKCAACGHELFLSDSKFDSSCGWPSFDKAIKKESVKTKIDLSHPLTRTEVICQNCGSHLGHVFNDGPTKTGKRYCINSVALEFKEKKINKKSEDAFFAAGCFWHVEETFRKLEGVIETEVGFMGGKIKNPTYKRVCEGDTNHAETVHIKFNPDVMSFKKLLELFFENHNPTTKNRQGFDTGTQYRSAIFYTTKKQKEGALGLIKALEKQKKFKDSIVTEVKKAGDFFRAEEYHQKYLMKNGLKVCKL